MSNNDLSNYGEVLRGEHDDDMSGTVPRVPYIPSGTTSSKHRGEVVTPDDALDSDTGADDSETAADADSRFKLSPETIELGLANIKALRQQLKDRKND